MLIDHRKCAAGNHPGGLCLILSLDRTSRIFYQTISAFSTEIHPFKQTCRKDRFHDTDFRFYSPDELC